MHLGFHFSKWDPIDADMFMERDNAFERNEFPVDVLWMDLDHTKNKMYFTFNEGFPSDKLVKMNNQIKSHDRRIVVITDPHIKK